MCGGERDLGTHRGEAEVASALSVPEKISFGRERALLVGTFSLKVRRMVPDQAHIFVLAIIDQYDHPYGSNHHTSTIIIDHISLLNPASSSTAIAAKRLGLAHLIP